MLIPLLQVWRCLEIKVSDTTSVALFVFRVSLGSFHLASVTRFFGLPENSDKRSSFSTKTSFICNQEKYLNLFEEPKFNDQSKKIENLSHHFLNILVWESVKIAQQAITFFIMTLNLLSQVTNQLGWGWGGEFFSSQVRMEWMLRIRLTGIQKENKQFWRRNGSCSFHPKAEWLEWHAFLLLCSENWL